jgi:hypothetical protein
LFPVDAPSVSIFLYDSKGLIEHDIRPEGCADQSRADYLYELFSISPNVHFSRLRFDSLEFLRAQIEPCDKKWRDRRAWYWRFTDAAQRSYMYQAI